LSELNNEGVAEVELPGIFSTIQDKGRVGGRRYGIPSSGALDVRSYFAANKLVGNAINAPAIEVIAGNFSIIFKNYAEIAITGARCKAYLDNNKVELDKCIDVDKGSRLLLSIPEYGFINYIAVRGGFWGEEVLSSRSTYVPGRFGGSWGRALTSNDILSTLDMTGNGYSKPSNFELSSRIKVKEGFHLNEGIREWMTSQKFIIEAESDRMGYRLSPQFELPSSLHKEIVTIPVFPGMIQLTKSGELVVVNKDGQTTGGYQVIGVMNEEELGNLVQLGPGAEVEFIM
jgi:Allophanate hydrolase subunit 2